MRHRTPCLAILVGAALAACVRSAGPPPRPPSPAQEAAASRAALVMLSVENRTDQRLAIAFLAASPPRTEIQVGAVDPGATARLAPVPADEPIQLIARRADGSELRLPARALNGDEFRWIIPAEAEFVPVMGGAS